MIDKALSSFQNWFYGLRQYKANGGLPALGTIVGALRVLEDLKQDYNLDIDAHTAEGGAQIRGAGPGAVRRLLADFGETRPLLAEGGRTNRGLRGAIKSMLDALAELNLHTMAPAERNLILKEIQRFLVSQVTGFLNRQPELITYDVSKSTRQAVCDILESAREGGKEGPVAQYLVGAKLQMRYPKRDIENNSFSTADTQLGRKGDFLIGDTAFHVTVAPAPAVYQKCKGNIENGYRAYLLVPDRRLGKARENADRVLPGAIAVESIESFVSQNVEEISEFSKERLAGEFRHLLDIYNQRVKEVEKDKSMLIHLPDSLLEFGAPPAGEETPGS